MRRARTKHEALACVIGSMDLVRPLGVAGIRCAVVVPAGDIAAHSRFVDAVIARPDPLSEPELLLERLLAFARSRHERPVLYYGTDADLLFVSRWRDALQDAFRFVVADAALVEDLVDKTRFRELADGLGLPVPASRRFTPWTSEPAALGLALPVVVKPAVHGRGDWAAVAGAAKAIEVDTADDLHALWPRLAGARVEVLAQELVRGPESRIESYHVYVDGTGTVAGEFAGRKIRTDPPDFGETTALVITAAEDVLALGRAVTARIGLRGVAKLDFKRDVAGRLHLLEVNPRFNLWHHPGALAGVNLPAIVHADLTGAPRPLPRAAQPGIRWMYHVHDIRAARRQGVPLRRWARFAMAAEAKSAVALDDPVPVIMGTVRRARDRVRRRPRRRD